MNVLILGGSQACGPGLPEGKDYMTQFAKRLRAGRNPVEIDYRVVSLAGAGRLLAILPLAHYDLIVLQFDLSVEWLPRTPTSRLLMRGKCWLTGHRTPYLTELRTHLANVLLQVRVFNRQVVVMSPLPHRRGLERQLATLAQVVYEQESKEFQVPLFSVSQYLPGGDELFQCNTGDGLSAVAHELLACELHTFVTESSYTLFS